MSEILWKHVLQPSSARRPSPYRYPLYDGEVFIPKSLAFPDDLEPAFALPDSRAYRSLSRAGILLAAAGIEAIPILKPFTQRDPFRVAMYCALENGPNDFNSAKQMIHTRPEGFAGTYKSLRSAKQYFKQLPNVPPSTLCIFLGLMGPLNVYHHSRLACRQALEQAEFDLASGELDAAVICSAFSLEDPLLGVRSWRRAPGDSILCECAAVLVLVPSHEYRDWAPLCSSDPNPRFSYGIASDLVTVCERTQKDNEYSDSDRLTGISECGESHPHCLEPAGSGHRANNNAD